MAKRRYSIDERTIEKRLKEGRGGGFGRYYVPWIFVHEVPSKGFSSIRKGWKTGRAHHFLSKLETSYFYMLEWQDEILDIREQFPLQREETKAIATYLGIEHPKDPRTKVDIVMTTDFVNIERSGFSNKLLARSAKYKEELKKNRTIEKLAIEKEYWKRRDVEWGIVTEKTIDDQLVRNVEWLHKNFELLGYFTGMTEEQIIALEQVVIQSVNSDQDKPLSSITDYLDQMLQLPFGTSLTMVKHLIAVKKIRADMSMVINPSKQLSLLN